MNHRVVSCCLLTCGLTASVSVASTIGYLDVSTSSGYADTVAINGIDTGGNGTFYGHQIAGDDFTLSLNMLGDSTTPRLGGSLQISNASSQEIQYVVGFFMPMVDVAPGEYDWGSSLTMAITGIDGTLRSLVEEPIWAGSAGDQLLGTMFAAPFELSFNGIGTAATEAAIDGGIHYTGGEMLSVRYAFELSPGDTVVFGGSVGFIPTPGALGLLGLAALTSRRRRRTACPAQTAQPDRTKPGSRPDRGSGRSRGLDWST